MFSGLAKAFAQLSDPPIRRLLASSIFGTLGAFAALWVVVGLAVEEALPSLGIGDWVLGVLGGVAVLVITWMLFPAVVIVVTSFFLERVAEAVEARHYPGLPPARSQPLAEVVWSGLRFMAVLVVLNLAALPLYLILPGLNLVIFYAVNGYLMAREYFEVVALRRVDAAAARKFWRRHRGRLFLAGVILAGLVTVPVLNLLTPVVATAYMVHLFHGLRPEAVVV